MYLKRDGLDGGPADVVLGGELREADHHAASVRAPVRSEETVETGKMRQKNVLRFHLGHCCTIDEVSLNLKFFERLFKQFSGSQETKWYNILVSCTLLSSILLYRRQ